jgi:hypothetical protein
MNQFLLGILKVYGIATLIYIIYLIFIKITNKETLKSILENNTELYEKYKKIKRSHTMVFIFGILVGLIILVINEPDKILEKINMSIKETINVSDISDISVI